MITIIISLSFHYDFIMILLKLILNNSFRYKEFRIIKTYDWIHATDTSNNNNKHKEKKRTKKEIGLTFGIWDPNKVNNKCPATMFAANRIDNVKGRIIFLTVSIITIIGIKNPGVPFGTKWENKLLYWNIIDIIILPNHRGKAMVNVNLIWLLLVKIYGNNPIKLEKIIKKKILI